MYKCSECNEALEVKRGSPVPLSVGLSVGSPVSFVTHARCTNSAADCVVSRTWLVVNEVDGRLLLALDGKTVVGH